MFKRMLIVASVVALLTMSMVAPAYARRNGGGGVGRCSEGTVIRVDDVNMYRCSGGIWKYVW